MKTEKNMVLAQPCLIRPNPDKVILSLTGFDCTSHGRLLSSNEEAAVTRADTHRPTSGAHVLFRETLGPYEGRIFCSAH